MAQAAAGNPLRLLTLTVNPRVGSDPADRLSRLAHAWRTLVKVLRRKYGAEAIAYLAIVEATKAGEPHLHILLRSPYIPHACISSEMGRLLDSPIVDIRRVRSPRGVIAYVAKYVTKAPTQFGTAKRYWASQNWQLPADTNEEGEPMARLGWTVDRRPLEIILNEWIHDAFIPRADGEDGILALYQPAAFARL